jgi:hypothetical protein
MKKLFILSILILFPLYSFGESISLLCKFDSKEEGQKRFDKSFPISIVKKKDGSYSIFRFDKNVEIPDKFISSVKVSDVSVTQNEISFNVYQVFRPNSPLSSNPGYESRTTTISRLDGRIMETVYWKGGFYEEFNPKIENPFILTGICEKRIQNKF